MSQSNRSKIELLSPAKNADYGITAINCGADAVYIGGPSFSARSAASNTINDIERLCEYAHLYGASVYVALNTILDEEELNQARSIAWELYNAGTDALIIQDYGLLNTDMPPIALHASTQMDNRGTDKVRFLEKCGFEQVVLPRESSLEDIRKISADTNVRLEAFVHGALCVSYSGQCYMSCRLSGRSANRGECAQPCRLKYSLEDANGKVVCKDKYLLSLKDFAAYSYIEDMIDAGVSAFKIEGRLKDETYVANTTAFYRKKIDEVLSRRKDLSRMSYGESELCFEPDIYKSFNRQFTDLNLDGNRKQIANIHTPKSMGEPIGKIIRQTRRGIEVDSDKELSNGDGFCYIGKDGELVGFRANTAQKGLITPSKNIRVETGAFVYRNQDTAFDTLLSKNTATRTIDIDITITELENGINIEAKSHCSGVSAAKYYEGKWDAATNTEMSVKNIKTAFAKTGGTPFRTNNIHIDMNVVKFIPNSVLTQWRREILECLTEEIKKNWKRRPASEINKDAVYPIKKADYRSNIHNSKSQQFLLSHGAEQTDKSFESTKITNVELMRCHHCIRYTLGLCIKRDTDAKVYKEPLTLIAPTGERFKLKFDCSKCEMAVIG